MERRNAVREELPPLPASQGDTPTTQAGAIDLGKYFDPRLIEDIKAEVPGWTSYKVHNGVNRSFFQYAQLGSNYLVDAYRDYCRRVGVEVKCVRAATDNVSYFRFENRGEHTVRVERGGDYRILLPGEGVTFTVSDTEFSAANQIQDCLPRVTAYTEGGARV